MPTLTDYNNYIIEIDGLYWMNLTKCKNNRKILMHFPPPALLGAIVNIKKVTLNYLNGPNKGSKIPYDFYIVKTNFGVLFWTT